MSQLNPVLSIYFKFLKYGGFILLINFVISGIATLVEFPQIRSCLIEGCEFGVDSIQERYEDKFVFRILGVVNIIAIIIIKMVFKMDLKQYELRMEI